MIIKESCEDFLVDEIPLADLYQEEAAQHHVYLLKKTNYTTQRAITHLGKALRIPRKYIGFAGTKDKQAITTQYITIAGAKKEKVQELDLKDLELSFCGYRKEKLSLGELEGNSFSILVKDVDLPKITIPSIFYVPNYFDDQRFSSHNVILGKLILKKQYKEAVEIIQKHDSDFKERFETHLAKQTNDYIGALRTLPRKILLFYVHAVQSYIFNEHLQKKLSQEQDFFEVTYSQGKLVFFKKLLETVDESLEGDLMGYDSLEPFEDIEPHDFINKSLPELALSGVKRPLYSKVTDCKLVKESQGIRVTFSLRKGSYATIVLKQLFNL